MTRPSKPFDKNGVLLKSGDRVRSCHEHYDDENEHFGLVMNPEYVSKTLKPNHPSLIVVQHDEDCCGGACFMVQNARNRMSGGVARHWIKVKQ